MRFARRGGFAKKAAPGKEGGGEQHQPRHEVREHLRRRREEDECAKAAAERLTTNGIRQRLGLSARKLAPTG